MRLSRVLSGPLTLCEICHGSESEPPIRFLSLRRQIRRRGCLSFVRRHVDKVHNAQEPVKILFVGGCHVGGYPCGEKLGFPQVAIDEARLPFAVEKRYLAYTTLRSAEAIERSCRDFRPHMLVLQMGHYETSRQIGAHVKRIFRPRPPGPDRSSSRVTFKTPVGTSFTPTVRSNIRSRIKLLVSFLLSCAGHPIFDAKAFRLDFGRMADRVSKLDIPHILVMSPLPLIDELVFRQHKHASEIMRVDAESRGWHWIDCLNLPRGGYGSRKAGLPDPELFADLLHLSVAGHRAVGMLLSKAIRRALEVDEAWAGATVYDQTPVSIF